jgi:DNA transposition AAA+ family ATPase
MKTTEIKDYMSDHGIKQKWLANKIMVSESYMSRMLSGDRAMPFWMQYRIEKTLNIKINGEL